MSDVAAKSALLSKLSRVFFERAGDTGSFKSYIIPF